MKNIKLIYLFYLLCFFSCSEKKNYQFKINPDIKIVITKDSCTQFACISVINCLNKCIYIPNIEQFSKYYVYNENSEDITAYIEEEFLKDFFLAKNEVCKKCFSLSKARRLSKQEHDSLKTEIIKSKRGLPSRLNYSFDNYVGRFLDDVTLLRPNESYNTFINLSDSLKYKKFHIVFYYPCSYSEYVGNSLPKEQIKYNIAIMDTFKFDYPKEILGYELYEKPFASEPFEIILK